MSPIIEWTSSGVNFQHPQLPTLSLRLAPTEVDWSYNLLTSETTTYAGQVVQVLGVNFDSFTIQGQFGRDGRDNYSLKGSTWMRQNAAGTVSASGPGLPEMTDWFRQYFAIASQGLPQQGSFDNYDQAPVTITYEGSSDFAVDDNKTDSAWHVYPINFPSYKISNENNVAPMWKVECQVYEAPKAITGQIMNESIERLAYAPLYQPGSKYSDPHPFDSSASRDDINKNALAAIEEVIASADFFMANLPNYGPDQISKLIAEGFSSPVADGSIKATQQDEHQGDPFDVGGIIGGV